MRNNIDQQQGAQIFLHKPIWRRVRNKSVRQAIFAAAAFAAAALFALVTFDSRVMSAGVAAPAGGAAPDTTDAEPVDGVGNNVNNPTWGGAPSDLIRLSHPAYADGIYAPSLPGNQSARAISNRVNNQADPFDLSLDIGTVDHNSLSDFGYSFGQFMDHDMDHTPNTGPSFPIPVAAGDPIGPAAIPFSRSNIDPATGPGTGKPAQQITDITSYFDLSQVYGSSQVVSDALRTFTGGQMKTSPGNMPPYDNTTYFTQAQVTALDMDNDSGAVPESELFATGDVRGNENMELTVLQILFLRNHNRIAALLEKNHPAWTDEALYQEARKLNIAEYQCIIYSQWIPAVLGNNALPPYKGYNPNINATIATEFSTVAFRFGHSLLSPSIARDNNDGQNFGTLAENNQVPLALDFFDPNILNPSGVLDPITDLISTDIGPVLKGDADGNAQAMDVMAISPIRNLLFGNGPFGGQDLIARDVQRGRDDGIGNYNSVRVAMGLPALTQFSQITGNAQVQEDLEAAYPGGINTIDVFEGGLAEDHVPGSDVGPLFQTIMVNQFERLRDGDRFFYLNEPFNAEETAIFSQTNTLAQVIQANTDVTNLQGNVMIFTASIGGTVSVSKPAITPKQVAGITVQLRDTSGDVLATTAIGPEGSYSFNQLSGPGDIDNPSITPGVSVTGFYQVVLVLPPGLEQTSTSPAQIEITHGGQAVTGVNFSVGVATEATSEKKPAVARAAN